MADEATEFEPITSQEQLDGILKGRLAREREKVASFDYQLDRHCSKTTQWTEQK